MKNRIIKCAVSAAALAPLVGCFGANFDGLIANIWRGFGFGLGSVPADIVAGFITGLLGVQ